MSATSSDLIGIAERLAAAEAAWKATSDVAVRWQARAEALEEALREVQDIIDAHPMPSQRLVNAVAIIEAALSPSGNGEGT